MKLNAFSALTLEFKFRPLRKMFEFKQDADVFQLVSVLKRCTLIAHNIIIVLSGFVEGVQVCADLRTKDAAVQCCLPYTYTEPITKDASVQCRRQPLLTSSPIHEHCNYPSDSEFVDTEDHNHTVDTSGFTFSPGSTSS